MNDQAHTWFVADDKVSCVTGDDLMSSFGDKLRYVPSTRLTPWARRMTIGPLIGRGSSGLVKAVRLHPVVRPPRLPLGSLVIKEFPGDAPICPCQRGDCVQSACSSCRHRRLGDDDQDAVHEFAVHACLGPVEGVCRVWPLFHQDGRLQLLMKAHPTNLRQILDYRSMTPFLWGRITLTVGQTLTRVHARGFLHLDVTPSNILLDLSSKKTITVVLSDFGLALPRFVDRPRQVRHEVCSLITRAPELMCLWQASPSTDAFSLGMVSLMMMLGSEHVIVPANFDIVTRIPEVAAIVTLLSMLMVLDPGHDHVADAECIFKDKQRLLRHGYIHTKTVDHLLSDESRGWIPVFSFGTGRYYPLDLGSLATSLRLSPLVCYGHTMAAFIKNRLKQWFKTTEDYETVLAWLSRAVAILPSRRPVTIPTEVERLLINMI